jgi:DNA-binding MarR family transcriptional regulator
METTMSRTGSNPGDSWRRLVARALVFHEAVAERLGINATDLKCLELAVGEDEITPTRLAELTGLTSGAITGVLDRLEQRGIVRREPDPDDRRRVVVRVDPARAAEITALYAPFLAATTELLADLSPEDRAVLTDYLVGVGDALEAEIVRARATARGGFIGDTYVAPLADATAGRLVFASGAPRFSMAAAALGQQARVVVESSASRLSFVGVSSPGELVRARFVGPTPEVRAAGGLVTIRYRRRLLDVRSRSARVALNGELPWSIEVDGGLTDLDGDLRPIRLAGLTVRGGANHLRLRLPKPDGTVRLAVAGGASTVRFERPRGVPVALRIRGGVSRLRFDDKRVRTASGDLELRSDDFGGSTDRYEIAFGGGASNLEVVRS